MTKSNRFTILLWVGIGLSDPFPTCEQFVYLLYIVHVIDQLQYTQPFCATEGTVDSASVWVFTSCFAYDIVRK